MAGAKEIRSQIGSIQNTQKITKAMQMVAASKMRKAQERMLGSRPYAERIRTVVEHITRAHSEYPHPYMKERPCRRVGVIVISSDRGLCGGLNNNLFRLLGKQIRQWHEEHIDINYCLIGSKAAQYFKNFPGEIQAALSHVGDNVVMGDLIGSIKVMLDAYNNGSIDKLLLVYNDFVNTMVQKPNIKPLLPIVLEEAEPVSAKGYWDYLYEPDAKKLLDGLLVRYIESQVYQAVVENNASEQAARMVAMRSATDNAGDLIDQLQLVYNKARQAAITQEIAEIVGGAAAV